MTSQRLAAAITAAFEQNSRDMCAAGGVSWRGSQLFLHSPRYPRHSRDTDCGCAVSVHPDVELQITLAQFESADGDVTDCDQVFYIQSGATRQRVCSEAHEQDYRPLDIEYDHNVHFKFENKQAEEFMMIIVLQGELAGELSRCDFVINWRMLYVDQQHNGSLLETCYYRFIVFHCILHHSPPRVKRNCEVSTGLHNAITACDVISTCSCG